ncbi:MAG: TolC family protein, partial [Woeseia sp.]
MKHRQITAFLLAAAALAGGCSVSGVTPDATNPAVPEAWARGGDAGMAGLNWLSTFNNPELERLVGEAIASNYFLEQERERLELARQGVTITRSNRLPVLDVSIDGQRRGSEDTAGDSFVTESFDASVSGRWDVDIWRRLSKQQQAAELALAAQRARLESVERDIAGLTASQLFNVMEATQLLQVAERRLDNAIESHDIVSSGYRQGLNDALDLYLARNQLERQQANFAQQQQLQLEAVANLQLSLARYPDGQMQIAGELPIIDDAIPAGLPS